MDFAPVEMPRNGRQVLVDLGNGETFIGTFRHGDFRDMKIEGPEGHPELTGWYPAGKVTLLAASGVIHATTYTEIEGR